MAGDDQPRDATDWDISDSYVKRFTQRATRLFFMAVSILLVIFALLGFGAFVFVHASGIAARDISRGEPGDLLSVELQKQSLESEIALLVKIRDTFREQFEVAQRTLLDVSRTERGLIAARGQLKIVEHKLLTHRRTGFMSRLESFDAPEELEIARDTLSEDLKHLTEIRNVFEEREKSYEYGTKEREQTEKQTKLIDDEVRESSADLVYVEDLLKQAQKLASQDAEAATGEPTALAPETVQILQTNITRFGTLLLIFFFIRIMLPIYRYFVSLGTIYRGQADALILVRQTDHKDLGTLVTAMTPTLGFEKAPVTPIENTLQLIKEIAPILARR